VFEVGIYFPVQFEGFEEQAGGFRKITPIQGNPGKTTLDIAHIFGLFEFLVNYKTLIQASDGGIEPGLLGEQPSPNLLGKRLH
jgi:hypothetical protein